MCSFLFTNIEVKDIDYVNHFLRCRGPDLTSSLQSDQFLYLHNLLSITGEFTQQPIVDNDIVMLYNGEVYNYRALGDYSSDGLCIVDAYKQSGVDSFKSLDGEFAIALHDKTKQLLYICCDSFATKPVFFAIQDQNICVSTYKSACDRLGMKYATKAKPNQVTVICLKQMKVTEEIELYKFDTRQHKNHYNDWEEAFESSIQKRVDTLRHNIVVPLSSGYDSGLISCVLNKKNVSHFAPSIRGKENQEILNQRAVLVKGKSEIFDRIDNRDLEEIRQNFSKYVENFNYGPNPHEATHVGFNDQGAVGLYFLLSEAKRRYDCKIVLSGQGSDEMMSTIKEYGFRTQNPIPFPENLETVFPWGNFYYGSMWSYIMKEECVAGSLGMETRYPFLDRSVIQEFLWLTAEMKNSRYKAPIESVFIKTGYPYYIGKMGFNIES